MIKPLSKQKKKILREKEVKEGKQQVALALSLRLLLYTTKQRRREAIQYPLEAFAGTAGMWCTDRHAGETPAHIKISVKMTIMERLSSALFCGIEEQTQTQGQGNLLLSFLHFFFPQDFFFLF